MLISCPECAAVYRVSSDVLPRESLGDRPQKMRCCKCKTVFLVSLKAKESKSESTSEPESESEISPGYEEFAAPFESDDSVEGDLTQVQLPRQKDGSLAPTDESEKLCVEVFDYREEPAGAEKDEGEAPEPLPKVVDDTGEWTTENVLSLTKFEVRPEVIKAQRKKAIGLVGAGGAFLLAFFVILAVYHSRWASSADEVPEQTEAPSQAEQGKTISQTPSRSGAHLQVEVEKRHTLEAAGGNHILVVSGRVANLSEKKQTRILVHGKLIDKDGRAQAVAKVPCGVVYNDARLQKQKKGTFGSLFKKRGQFLNCGLRPGQNKKFKLIFEGIPKDSQEAGYRVEVTADSGK